MYIGCITGVLTVVVDFLTCGLGTQLGLQGPRLTIKATGDARPSSSPALDVYETAPAGIPNL